MKSVHFRNTEYLKIIEDETFRLRSTCMYLGFTITKEYGLCYDGRSMININPAIAKIFLLNMIDCTINKDALNRLMNVDTSNFTPFDIRSDGNLLLYIHEKHAYITQSGYDQNSINLAHDGYFIRLKTNFFNRDFLEQIESEFIYDGDLELAIATRLLACETIEDIDYDS